MPAKCRVRSHRVQLQKKNCNCGCGCGRGCGCGCGCGCCCCWQHVRLPPRGVCRFPGWHVLKLEFWHFPLPKLNLRFLFLSVFAVFLAKKSRKTAACTVQKPARRSVSHRFCSVFSCLCRLSHRYLQCFGHLATFCTCQLRLAFVFQVSAGVWGGGGDGGGGGKDCDWCSDFLLLTFFCYVVILCVSPFASVFAVFWPSLDFLHMPASTCTYF